MSCRKAVIIFIIAFLIIHIKSAYVKNVTVYKTCGLPPEQYFRSWQANLLAIDRQPYLCNASDPNFSHPPENMFDNDESSFWQSTGGLDNVEIILDIRSDSQKYLFVDHLVIKFGDSQRPGQIKLSKSVNGGLDFSQWHFIVSEAEQCSSIFKVAYAQTPNKVDDILCALYEELVPQSTNETVVIDMMGGRGTSSALQNWLKATHLKLEFSGLFKRFDIFSARWHHYNIREMTIQTSCHCNGHASMCIDKNNNGNYECVCENNACGTKCDMCCPKFNQRAWVAGAQNPFVVDNDAKCKECNCFNHSDSCYYNETIAKNKKSLNMSNIYDGGGVCTNCQHNSTGINCEQCEKFFFHSPKYDISHPNTCQPCNCSLIGSSNGSSIPYLDCIKDSSTDGKKPGDCFCKENVNGRQCDSCKQGYFNLTKDNILGCDECKCNSPGTVNGSVICSDHGQCICKQNVYGLKCDRCKEGYFNLTDENMMGCADCLCNLGGSQTKNCNVTTGVCLCRNENIINDKCSDINEGYFYPSVHFIKDVNLQQINTIPLSFTGMLDIPTEASHSINKFKFILKCTTKVSAIGFISVTSFPDSEIRFVRNCKNCYVMTDVSYDLAVGRWNIEVSFPTVTSLNQITCHEIIGIPEEFYDPKSLREKKWFQTHCNVLTGSMNHSDCVSSVFSITMDYLHEPLNCSCNLIGSLNSTCAKYMGQCFCKQGITGRRCDTCLPGYYNFTEKGCQPCDCYGNNTVCDKRTGQCQCSSHTISRGCNQCAVGYWNLTKDSGCQPCTCNMVGSLHTGCNQTDGQCPCKQNVVGRTCSECLIGFKNFSINGCSLCNCSLLGSKSFVCNKSSGDCVCKNATEGKLCDKCTSGSFYLNGRTETGCLDCFCMGMTKNCSAMQGNFNSISPRLDWSIGLLQDPLLILISIYNTTNFVNGSSVLMLSAAISRNSEELFWKSNLVFGVSSYGGSIEFVVISTHNNVGDSSLMNGQQKVVLKGYGNISIYQEFNATKNNSPEKVKLILTENNWKEFNNNMTISRHHFLTLLSKPVNIYITISPYHRSSSGYFVRLGEFKYFLYKPNKTFSSDSPVEKCNCPVGYQGYSCETCENGFYHSTVLKSKHIFGDCLRCDCNSRSNICNKETGECIGCRDNTTGRHCEICKPNFYSIIPKGENVTCVKCPCYLPYTNTELCEVLNNTSVACLNCSIGYTGQLCQQCDQGYFLSENFCIPCQCNNHSSTCNNITGECDSCQNKTAGKYCERCMDGWYGNASLHQCKECKCNTIGSLNNTCDGEGQCSCRNNVVGEKCSSCKQLFYGLNNMTGCDPCSCNIHGSTNLQCDDNGKCTCKPNILGAKCDKCIEGLWGSPNTTCQECLCNATGSHNMSCDMWTGQCFCKPGVTNRNCSICSKQHRNFTEAGCDACPGCSQLLQKYIDQHAMMLTNLMNEANIFREVDQLNVNFDNVSMLLNNSLVDEMNFGNRLRQLNSVVIKSNNLKTSADYINTYVGNQVREANYFLNEVLSEQARLTRMKNNVSLLFENILETNVTSRNVTDFIDTLIVNSLIEIQLMDGIDSKQIQLLNDSLINITQLTLNESSHIDNLIKKVDLFKQNITKQSVGIRNESAIFNFMLVDYNELTTRYENLTSLYYQLLNISESLNRSTAQLVNIEMSFLDELNKTSSLLWSATRDMQSSSSIGNVTSNINKELNDVLFNSSFQIDIENIRTSVSLGKPFINQSYASNITTIAKNISSQCQVIKKLFDEAQQYTSKVLVVTQLQENVTAFIKSLYNLTSILNKTIPQVFNLAPFNTIENITSLINITSLETETLHTNAQKQLLTVQDNHLKLTNLTSQFQSLNLLWQNISNSLNNQSQSINNFSGFSETSSEVLSRFNDTSSEALSILVNELQNRTQDISTVLKSVKSSNYSVVDGMQDKYINDQNNLTIMLNNLTAKEKEIEEKLNNTLMMSSLNISFNVINNFTKTHMSVHERLERLKLKIEQVKQSFSKYNSAIELDGKMSLKFEMATNTKHTQQLVMTLKTLNKNSIILDIQDDFSKRNMVVGVKENLLFVNYTYINQNYSIVNYAVPIADGDWKQVLFSRYLNSSRLTVTDIEIGFGRTYGSFVDVTSTEIFDSSFVQISIGGNKTNLFPLTTSSPFKGCIYDLRVDSIKIDLLSLLMNKTTNQSVCDIPKVVSLDERVMNGTSFGGAGYLVHRIGNFSLMKDFGIIMKFRTLKSTSMLLSFESHEKKQLLSISLIDQQLIVTISSPTQSFFKSKLKNISNGEWFILNLQFINEGVTMNILQNNTILESTYVKLPRLNENGHIIWVGGYNHTRTDRFVGCIEYLILNNTHNDDVIKLNGDSLIEAKGVNFNGCYKQVVEGLHIYEKGYSSIHFSSEKLLELVDITFKTKAANGIIFTYKSDKTLLSISLYHGNILIVVDNHTMVSMSQTLNDGQIHRVKLSVTDSKYTFDLDNGKIIKSLAYSARIIFTANSSAYIGEYPQASNEGRLPVKYGFVGDLLQFKLNGISYLNVLLNNSSRVSADEISTPSTKVTPTNAPTYPPTTSPPPSCSIDTPLLEQMNNSNWIGFNGTSRLSINPENPDSFISLLKQNYVITIEFRAFAPNGLLLYMAGNHGNHFITLELINGALKYQFRTDKSLMSITSKLSNYANGQWHTVFLIRLARLGMIMIKNDFIRQLIDSTSSLNITLPFYMGNIPSDMNTTMLNASSLNTFHGCIRKVALLYSVLQLLYQASSLNTFHGCIRKVTVTEAKEIFDINLSKHASNISSVGLRSCYVNVMPYVTFRSTGYYVTPNNITTANLSIEIDFSTSRLNGVLWFIGTERDGLYLRFFEGKVSLMQISNYTFREILSWVSEEKLWNNQSFYLCDGRSKVVYIEKVEETHRLFVNEKLVAMSTIIINNVIGPLYIAGTPKIPVTGFYGCIGKVNVAEKPVDFSLGESVAMHFGCTRG